MKHTQQRITESSNITEILNDLGSKPEADVHYASENETQFELFRQFQGDSEKSDDSNVTRHLNT
jgi:hypothetical protein